MTNTKQFIIQLLDMNGGQICGKNRLQKLLYLCRVMGAGLDASYCFRIHGPFSQEVSDVLHDCIADNVLSETNGIIQKGGSPGGSQPLPEEAQGIISHVLEICRGMGEGELERMATIVFITKQRQALFGDASRETVLSAAIKAMGKRFTEKKIMNAYDLVEKEILNA